MTIRRLTVAMLQMRHVGTEEANMERADQFCRHAAEQGADLAIMPELYQIGYQPPFTMDRAVARAGEFVRHFEALARTLSMAVAVTYLETWPGKPRNAVTIFDASGVEVLTYAKLHTCSFSHEGSCTAGDDVPVAVLMTKAGPVTVGAMICFDREFPETARLLALAGAELIVVPNACDLEQNRWAQLRSRSFENMVAMAVANYAEPDANGRSALFDGQAFGPDEGSRDMVVVEASSEEGTVIGDLDLDALRDYRAREVWGATHRRPERYGGLVAVNGSDRRPHR